MSSSRDYMVLEYAGIPAGATLSSQMCPSCNGGASGEASMSVGKSDEGLLWWRCHRNKCDFSGMYGTRLSQNEQQVKHAVGRWNYEPEPLSKAWLEWLADKYDMDEEVLDKEWKWTDSYGGRVIMPVKSERGVPTGRILRSHTGDTPKALAHRLMEDIGCAWYYSDPYPSHVIITEDQPSALKASLFTGVAGIALLGTNVHEELVNKLRFVYDHSPVVLLALDQDATLESAKQVIQWRNVLPKLRMLPLDKDIKDMTFVECTKLIEEIKQ